MFARRRWALLAVAAATLAGCHLAVGLGDLEKVDGDGGGGGQAGAGGQGGTGGQGGVGGGASSCGDGMVNQASEMCDEGPQNTANCDNDCTLPECGDGLHNVQAGEGCDDGNMMDGDGCDSQCVSEMCGNGVQDASEECDDGNMVNNDDCLNNCNLPTCGDGVVHDLGTGSEQCDDGNGDNADACPDGVNGSCLSAFCGDGFVQMGQEECDAAGANGNNSDCLTSCIAASCGDGFIHNQGTGTEACDDGDANGADGCSATCVREPGWCCDGEPSACTQGPFTLSASGLGITIPDGGFPNNVACHPLTFTQLGCGAVTGVEMTVGINHNWIGDLVISLTNPGNTLALLMDRPGVPGSMYGDASNLDAAYPITFLDGAATSAEAMGGGVGDNGEVCKDAPFICNYDPSPDALSTVHLADPTGSWTVCVGDDGAMITGTLQSVAVTITTQ